MKTNYILRAYLIVLLSTLLYVETDKVVWLITAILWAAIAVGETFIAIYDLGKKHA